MGMIEDVRAQMMQAMKDKDKDRKNTLSMLLGALKNGQINKMAELTPDEEIAIVKREIKQAKETIDTCPADRTDIISECESKIAVLKEFVPEEMSADQIKAVIVDVLKELGIETPTAKDKGKIMKDLMPKVKGKADGKLVNDTLTSMFK